MTIVKEWITIFDLGENPKNTLQICSSRLSSSVISLLTTIYESESVSLISLLTTIYDNTK